MPQLEITTFSSQIFWLLVTFTMLFLIIWRISVPKISDTLETRQKRIDDNLLRAEELKKDAEVAMDTYKSFLNEAHLEAQNIIIEANSRLTKESELREANLTEALASRVLESEKNIEKAMNDAVTHIRDSAIEVATSAVERLSGTKPNADDANAAVDLVINRRK